MEQKWAILMMKMGGFWGNFEDIFRDKNRLFLGVKIGHFLDPVVELFLWSFFGGKVGSSTGRFLGSKRGFKIGQKMASK